MYLFIVLINFSKKIIKFWLYKLSSNLDINEVRIFFHKIDYYDIRYWRNENFISSFTKLDVKEIN